VTVDEDITRARTPPPELYTSAAIFERVRRRVLAAGWHMAPSLSGREVGEALPFELLPGVLDLPLALVRGADGVVRCLSNVCTHRANLVVEAPGCLKSLRCRYHGRRFSLDGRFAFMPEFEGAADFPDESDNLVSLPLEHLGPIPFVGLQPSVAFADLVEPIRERLAFAPWSRLERKAERVYEVAANWALYVENYLEGFHVPFVHPGLAEALDYASYRTEIFAWSNLQVGVAKRGESSFALPPDHPDAGQAIAAYYFWVFPATMVNVYPWGVSMNAVEPLAIDRTRIRFVSWVWDEGLSGSGAGADLDTVEMEDEAVVASVQRGVRSPLYKGGRYSPSRERGVHHFHRLLTAAL
jgi:choline monooxygenase